MPESLALLIGLVALAVAFGVANGFNDAANAIATVIGTRVLSPRAALVMASFFSFVGAATGTAVAITIGQGIIAPQALTMGIVLAGTVPAVIWTFAATHYGMPVSTTHGLVGGLVGAGMATGGGEAIVWNVLARVISAVGIAPLLGLVAGFSMMVAISWLFRKSSPDRARGIFGNLQILSAAFLAYSHGKNNGQMPMGLMAMALMAYTGSCECVIPFWTVLASGASISFGIAAGGWRVIRTLGLRMTTLRPVHGFAAETSAAAVVEVASHLGIPVSTTHCISTAIMGVGATRRLSAVRWGIARDIVLAWLLTFPACGALGWLLALVLRAIF